MQTEPKSSSVRTRENLKQRIVDAVLLFKRFRPDDVVIVVACELCFGVQLCKPKDGSLMRRLSQEAQSMTGPRFTCGEQGCNGEMQGWGYFFDEEEWKLIQSQIR